MSTASSQSGGDLKSDILNAIQEEANQQAAGDSHDPIKKYYKEHSYTRQGYSKEKKYIKN